MKTYELECAPIDGIYRSAFFCRNRAPSFINVAGVQCMHMQMKPAQKYFRHEKKNTLAQIWQHAQTKHSINSTPCAYNNGVSKLWIGTLNHGENSEFVQVFA